jgi:Tfp pilus assembly protein PilW
MREHIRKDNTGITLVELMIVLVLSLLLMSAAYMAYQAQNVSGNVQHQIATLQQDLRAVLDIMEKDIRNAGCDPRSANITAVLADTSGITRIAVTADLDGDGTTNGANEHVIYELNGISLQRNNQALAQNVTSFGVTYLDQNDAQIIPAGAGNTLTTAQTGQVLAVQMNIWMRSNQRDPETGNFMSRNQQRRIALKNMAIRLFD